jgi:hypothetical protein
LFEVLLKSEELELECDDIANAIEEFKVLVPEFIEEVTYWDKPIVQAE